MTIPNKPTANEFIGYSPINAVGKGMKACPMRKIEFSQTIPWVA